MDQLPDEMWFASPIYEGIEASSHGRIRRPQRIGVMPNGSFRTYELKPTFGIITKSCKSARHVYFALRVRGIGNVKVHRAVCSAFHGAPLSAHSVVIHINENGFDNRPENLRWGTQKENLNAPGFTAYSSRRRSWAVRKGTADALATADIYFGLPHLLQELKNREVAR